MLHSDIPKLSHSNSLNLPWSKPLLWYQLKRSGALPQVTFNWYLSVQPNTWPIRRAYWRGLRSMMDISGWRVLLQWLGSQARVSLMGCHKGPLKRGHAPPSLGLAPRLWYQLKCLTPDPLPFYAGVGEHLAIPLKCLSSMARSLFR